MNDAGIPPKVGDQPLQFTPLLQLLSQDMDNLTRHADFKAQIILAINAILTATAVGQASRLPSDPASSCWLSPAASSRWD